MSDDWFEAWMYGGDTYDRRTRQALEEQAAMESRARSRLHQQMRKEQGNLQAQIDRLTKAFVAFVEYEDVRGELNQYADAAAVRRYAREVAAGLVMTGGSALAGIPTPPDVRGYWLAAAAHGVALAAKGADSEADERLAEAAARDPQRTATFLVLLDVLSREPRWTERHLDAVLPEADPVTVAQRAVWTGIAEGRLGATARTRLEAALAALVGQVDPAVVDDWVAQRAGSRGGGDALPAVRAADRLATLRAVVTGTGEPADPTEKTSSEDPLADCLMTLVDQGAPGEAEILDRMEAARAEMGFVEPRSKDRGWDAPDGAALDLLLADLGDATAPARQAVARRVLAPALLAAADRLADEARTPAPAERTVRTVGGTSIAVTAEGAADSGWRTDIESAAQLRSPVPGWPRPSAIGAAAVAGLALVLMVVSPWFAVLAVAAAGFAGYCVLTERTARAEHRSTLAASLRRAEADVGATTEQVVSDRERAAQASTAAADHHAAITAALRPVS